MEHQSLKDQLSILGMDCRQEIEKERISRWPKTCQVVISKMNLGEFLGKDEEDDKAIFQLLNEMYSLGFYHGVNVGLNTSLINDDSRNII